MTILVGGVLDDSKSSVKTGRPVRASKVTAPTERCAVCVMTTRTVAPSVIRRRASDAALYAAMLPVTPSTMVFPVNRAADARGLRLVDFTRLRRLGVVHDDAQVLLDLVRVFTAHVRQGQPFQLALPLLARFLHGLAGLLSD